MHVYLAVSFHKMGLGLLSDDDDAIRASCIKFPSLVADEAL